MIRLHLLCAAGLLALAPSGQALPAQAAAPTSADFARHGTLGQPELSPDGHHLAVSVREEKDGKNRYQLAILHLPDLKAVSRLDLVAETLPADILWVNDQRVVVGLATERGSLEAPARTGEVVSVDLDGSTKRTLYSPALRGKLGANANMLNIPGGFGAIEGRPPTPNGHFYLAVSPFEGGESGKSLLYDVDTVSGAAREIGSIGQRGMSFVVHEGVARYAYGTDADNTNVSFYRDGADAAWVKLDPAKVGKSFQPLRLSADGKQVYALSHPDGGPDALSVSALDGSERKVLAENPRVAVSEVVWSPAPRTPVAAVLPDGRPGYAWIAPDHAYAKILKALNGQFPDHFVRIAGASQDGATLLIHAASDRDAGTYALLDTASMNLRPLYQVQPWMKPEALGERRPFRFTASSGTELMGFLTLPPGREAKHLPLVLLPHGGPIGPADDWFYDGDAQFLATRGYAVLQVNFRGSGGRGENFMRSGYREMGTGMQQDMIDAVHWAIDQGYADKARLAVYGGSYGGYSALMQPIRAPGLYRCAIDYAGVSDLRIQAERSDTRRFKTGRLFLDQAWGVKDEDYVRQNSPLDLLGQFKVPVLIIHGEDDPRVPLQNAKALRSALDKAGKPYEWLVRAHEAHGFFAEKNNRERYDAMEAFLAKHLAATPAP